MKYMGKITDPKDLVTKEYVDDGLGDKYEKPATGIPETDLASSVQTSLGKADTALQSHQDISGKLNASLKGAANGVAELDANGKVPLPQLPTPETIAQTTTEWLAENVTQETGYVIDGSLSIEGAAADAKKTGDEISDLKNAVNAKTTGLAAKAPAIYETVGPAAIANFSDGADGMPLSLVVSIEPVQSGTGDPSPENVRPITGWTGCAISQSGADTSDPDTYAVTFTDPNTGDPLTVYGGTLTVNADGSADLISSYVAYNMGALSWNADGDNTQERRMWYATMSSSPLWPSGSLNAYCTMYAVKWSWPLATIKSSGAEHCLYGRRDYRSVYIVDSRYATASAFKAAVNGQTLVVPLATPITYHFDNIGQINTLFGVNNIWADTGDVTVEYPADSKLYIDSQTRATRSLIAGIETTMTASKAYAAGDLLIVGDTLYKAAASIASGAALTPGTNVNQTTVAEQLLLLASKPGVLGV